MDLDIGGKPAGRVVMGLYGKEAPNTVENFMRLVEGRGQGGATYLFSSVFRVEPGKCIDLGRITGGGGKKLEKKINESGVMRVSSANAAEWTRNDDTNLLRHDKPFLLTTNRGGGTYEFSITLSPNAKLDRDHLVFGRMLEVHKAQPLCFTGLRTLSVLCRPYHNLNFMPSYHCVSRQSVVVVVLPLWVTGPGGGGVDPQGAREQGRPPRQQDGTPTPSFRLLTYIYFLHLRVHGTLKGFGCMPHVALSHCPQLCVVRRDVICASADACSWTPSLRSPSGVCVGGEGVRPARQNYFSQQAAAQDRGQGMRQARLS